MLSITQSEISYNNTYDENYINIHQNQKQSGKRSQVLVHNNFIQQLQAQFLTLIFEFNCFNSIFQSTYIGKKLLLQILKLIQIDNRAIERDNNIALLASMKTHVQTSFAPTSSIRTNFSQKFMSQFISLIGYLRHAPKISQELFAPYVAFLANQKYQRDVIVQGSISILKASKCPLSHQMTQIQLCLFEKIIQMLSLHKIFNALAQNQRNQKAFLNFLSYYHNIKEKNQNMWYSSTVKIDLIRPQYYLTQIIAKYEAQMNIGQRFTNQQPQQSLFYKQPRFLDKLAELVHFRKNQLHRGDIALLQYNGNFIKGNRVYAVAKDAHLQIWQKTSDKYPYPFQGQNPYLDQEDSSQDEDQTQSNTTNNLQQLLPKQFQLERSFRFIGHSSKVTCASFSQDEFYIITGSTDKTIKLWCLRLNILLATYHTHTKTLWDLHFNPSGLYFLSGSADTFMVLWKTDSPKPQRIFVHKSDVYKVHFAKNPSFALSAGEEGILRIWNIVSASVLHTIQTDRPIINFNLGHSGAFILILETDGRASLHNIKQGVFLTTFYFHNKSKTDKNTQNNCILDCCFSEDQKNIACVTHKHILLYSMQSLSLTQNTNDTIQLDNLTNSKPRSKGRVVNPYLVLMSSNSLRFTYCRFRHRNTLVVGATKHTP